MRLRFRYASSCAAVLLKNLTLDAYNKNAQVINESTVHKSSTTACNRLSSCSLASNRVAGKPYSQSRGAGRLAKAFQPRPGGISETYVAYGMTRQLFDACSSQADYRIPQVSQKGAEVPKTSAGEDIGVGDSWWYKGPYNTRSTLL